MNDRRHSAASALPVLVASLLWAGSVTAQSSRESIEVSVANVDVVVLSSDGAPVSGLTASDFELLVDGKPTAISNFYAEAAATRSKTLAAADAEAVGETALLYLDQSAFSTPLAWSKLGTALVQFSSSLLSECTHCRVGVYGRREGNLITLVEPTADASMIRAALLREHKTQSGTAIVRAKDVRQLPRGLNDPKHQTAALSALLTRAGTIPGRKVLALITNSPLTSAPESLVTTLHIQNGRDADPFERSAKIEQDEALIALADLANSAGVSVYPIISSGLTEMEIPMNIQPVSNPRHVTSLALSRRISELDNGVRGLAERTGGRMQSPTTNFQLPLQHVSQDLQTYYSLGFRTEPNARHDSIRVRVRGRSELTIRARRSLHRATGDEWILAQASLPDAPDAGGPVGIQLSVTGG